MFPIQGGISDVLILGGGHAGLSAALTLYRHQHDIIIFDADKPRNRWQTPTHSTSGWENKQAGDFKRASKEELEKTGFVRFVDQEVQLVEKKDASLFSVTTTGGERWEGRKILLAMGAEFVFPEIPGYEANFPSKILHCLFTFGFEHRGSASAGILSMGYAANPFHASILIEDASKFAEKVTVYTNGDPVLVEAIKKKPPSDKITFDSRKIVGLTNGPGESRGITIEFEDGESKTEDFIVHQPPTRINPAIVKQLGLELDARGDIVTKGPFYQTTVPGVFAAGDCASPFKIIPNAMLMGANAGAGIARELPRSVTCNLVDRLGN